MHRTELGGAIHRVGLVHADLHLAGPADGTAGASRR